MTKDDALVAALSAADIPGAGSRIDAAERVMLDYSAKLTRTPQQMEEGDVAALRDAGFDDRSIHDIAVVAAYYAFVNRIADGLGVALEPGWNEADE